MSHNSTQQSHVLISQRVHSGTDATWALFAFLNPLTEEKRASFDDVHYNGPYIGLALSRGHTRAEESFTKNALLIHHEGRKQKSHSH
ncbi:hypothetical protein F2P79_004232 [Pimephales promelas]|nr:hypothetical protein F2P79_004232 [Pimephales promelas]